MRKSESVGVCALEELTEGNWEYIPLNINILHWIVVSSDLLIGQADFSNWFRGCHANKQCGRKALSCCTKEKKKKSYKLVSHLPDFCCRKIVLFMCFVHQCPPWPDSIGSRQKGEIREHRFYRPSCGDHKCFERWFDVNCNLWSFSQTSVNGANCPRNFQTLKTHPLVTGPSLLSSQTINYQLPDTFSPPFTVREPPTTLDI